jgi:methenyltetrahydrofolate cyclohydrolase
MEGTDLVVRERAHATEDYDPPVSGLGEQSLASILDDVAAATPAPGGGTSAALALALAAGLVEMSALLAGEEGAASRAASVRREAVELAERELTSYAPVLEAMRLPAADPGREARVAEALLEASRAPLAIAEAAAEVASLGAEVERASSPSVRGDALAGTTIAEAAAGAAAGLVEINLERQPSAPELARAREAAARAGEQRLSVR